MTSHLRFDVSMQSRLTEAWLIAPTRCETPIDIAAQYYPELGSGSVHIHVLVRALRRPRTTTCSTVANASAAVRWRIGKHAARALASSVVASTSGKAKASAE